MTSKTAPSRFDAVSSGPKSRKSVGLRAMTSRRKPPSTRVASLVRRRRAAATVDGVVAEVGQHEVAQQHAAVRVRVRAHPALARRRRARRSSGTSAAVVVEELLGPVAPQPVLEHGAGARGSSRTSASGTWCERQRALDRHAVDLASARSSPSACAGRSSASAGARRSPSSRAARWISRDLVERLVERGGEALVHVRRVVAVEAAVTSSGRQP